MRPGRAYRRRHLAPVQFLGAIDLAAVITLAGDLQPVLIVIDTQARVTVGADENSARALCPGCRSFASARAGPTSLA